MIRVFGRALARTPKGEAPERHAALRTETLRNQALASDPTASAWVSANAGTGKTHVLTNRVLRLLLAGTPAERILALTYTKAAAAEMAKRVFQRLAEWTTAAEAELDAKLTPLLGRTPSGEDRRLARQLLARTIETPGGLKVETIHAFCERLLKRFPLEAGVAPNFTILDDQQRQGLITQAVDEMLGVATADKAGPLWSALKGAIAYAVDGNFERLLAEAFGFGDGAQPDEDGPGAREAQLRARLGVRQEATPEVLAQELGGLLSEAEMRDLVAALRLGGKTDQDRAEDLERALGCELDGRSPRRLGSLLSHARQNAARAPHNAGGCAARSCRPVVGGTGSLRGAPPRTDGADRGRGDPGAGAAERRYAGPLSGGQSAPGGARFR